MKSILNRAVLAMAGAATLATGAPVVAHAQSYNNYGNQGYYAPCQKDKSGRTVAGALIGGLAGMALGNNIGDDRRFDRRGRVHDNDTNATVGAVLGGLAGASIGANSARCGTAYQPQTAYNTYDNGYRYQPEYSQRDDYYDGYAQDRYAQDRYAQAPSYRPPAYQDYGYAPQASCTYVESNIRMPDGRTQKRMVHVCPDRNGRYQTVE